MLLKLFRRQWEIDGEIDIQAIEEADTKNAWNYTQKPRTQAQNDQNLHRKQRLGFRPRPTGALRAPVVAFCVESDRSVPEREPSV